MGWLSKLTPRGWSVGARGPSHPVIQVSSLTSAPPTRFAYNDGEKFPGGFGVTDLLITDYWQLRARSTQLFETNHYARGLIRRLVTNEINTGLHLEATPEESLLGFGDNELAPWTDEVENRFSLWSKNPKQCDHVERSTYGQLQRTARLESLVTGDVLVVLMQNPDTFLPRIRLVNGSAVQTPLQLGARVTEANGNTIVHGVEVDPDGRHVAYHIRNVDGTSERLSAIGKRTGRRVAWLVYGTDKRMDEVRGKPMLSLMLQSLKEIDRYRDSVQRKAVINSRLAMFIKKTEDKPGTQPMGGGAVRRGTETAIDSTGTERTFNVTEGIPGLILDELQQGETPEGFMPHGTDEKFGDFENSILQSVAWSLEIPPEILWLAFTNNYSASQAAINEFKMYLNKSRTSIGEQMLQPIYNDWLLSQVLMQKIEAAGLLESWRDPSAPEVFDAWATADWTGHIKPAVDFSKLVSGYEKAIDEGLISRTRAARELTGTKFDKNVQKLKRENEALAEANKPLEDLEKAPSGLQDVSSNIDDDDDDDEEEGAAA